jgi:hypothetical protein
VVVAEGDTTVLPFKAMLPRSGFIVTELALFTVQVKVADCPALIVEGLTLKLTTAAGVNAQPDPRRDISTNMNNIFFT